MEKEKKRNERKGEWKKVAIEENKKKRKIFNVYMVPIFSFGMISIKVN